MKNRDIYFKDPAILVPPNGGVARASEIHQGSEEERARLARTLRFELETFVCDGEFARGMARILTAYLESLHHDVAQAAWVSGFFGSGRSHLVKVLRYLWEDYRFEDSATARSLVKLPSEVSDLFTELSTRSKALGGLRAVAGSLIEGGRDNVRLAFIRLVLRAVGLPENIAQARFRLWLRDNQLEAPVSAFLTKSGRTLAKEVAHLRLSRHLVEALVVTDPKLATPAAAQAAIRDQFKDTSSPTISDVLDFVRRIFGDGSRLPCTLIVVDDIGPTVGSSVQQAFDLNELICCLRTSFEGRLMFVGVGETAFPSTHALARLMDKIHVRIQLSHSDDEMVTRKTILRKKPESEAFLRQFMDTHREELARHLQGTCFAMNESDNAFLVADYPLLPTRRRFWEAVLSCTSTWLIPPRSLSSFRWVAIEAVRISADRDVGSVVSADYIYDQISSLLLTSGQLSREHHETIIGQRDGTPDGSLRSRLCALAFLIGKLSGIAGINGGIRATEETLIDLLVEDLEADRVRLEGSVPIQLERLVTGGLLACAGNEYQLSPVDLADSISRAK